MRTYGDIVDARVEREKEERKRLGLTIAQYDEFCRIRAAGKLQPHSDQYQADPRHDVDEAVAISGQRRQRKATREQEEARTAQIQATSDYLLQTAKQYGKAGVFIVAKILMTAAENGTVSANDLREFEVPSHLKRLYSACWSALQTAGSLERDCVNHFSPREGDNGIEYCTCMEFIRNSGTGRNDSKMCGRYRITPTGRTYLQRVRRQQAR